MEKRCKTRNTLLAAVGSLVDLLPTASPLELRHRRASGTAADARAIAGDFRAVGRDIERAMKRLSSD